MGEEYWITSRHWDIRDGTNDRLIAVTVEEEIMEAIRAKLLEQNRKFQIEEIDD